MDELVCTITGNLTKAPELRHLPSGLPVTTLRVASTPRKFNKDTNSWGDGETLFMDVDAWRQLAEHCAESLTKGQRVVCTGKLKQRTYETKTGENRTVLEMEADDVGISLKWDSIILEADENAPF